MLEQAQDAKIWLSFHLTRWLRPQQRVLLDGLIRGLGRKTFTLTEGQWEDSSQARRPGRTACPWAQVEAGGCTEVQRLMARIDEVICLAPTPVGIGDFMIRVRVFKRPPERASRNGSLDWRRLLACEYFLDSEARTSLLSRYHDWKHGDAKQRLITLLCQHCPTPAEPLIEVAVTSIGQLLVDLVSEERINFGADGECDRVPSALS